MPAPNAAALLRANGTDAERAGRPAIRFGDRIWNHEEYLAESVRWANLFLERRLPDRPFHVGVLLDNTPDYLFALGGAGLVGAAVVGLNHTRQGEHLVRDIRHTDVGLVVTEPRHQDKLSPIVTDAGLADDAVVTSDRFVDDTDPPLSLGERLDDALDGVGAEDPGLEPDPDTIWALIFTSGTSSAPKAVICSQRRLLVTGVRLGMILGVTPDDVGYVCMPLFHSNAVMVGWAPSIVYGASVGLARRFSASGWLDDVRLYGATWFNYTGKPLSYLVATPERPDDGDNPLRVAYGNEGSPEVVRRFGERFETEVTDVFGSTEGAIAVDSSGLHPKTSVGRAGSSVLVVDDQGTERAPARIDDAGRLLNPDDCVGEIVSTRGAGPFEGYYNNPDATDAATRDGWYWSGDLGYVDEDGFLYFAGRTADWIRVDGENFPAEPIQAAICRHPDVTLAVVYGVPDTQAGDQVMAAVTLRGGAEFDPAGWAEWVDRQADIGPKWRPRYVRIAAELPTTGTNKVLTRRLVREKFRSDLVGSDPVFVRGRGDDVYRPFTADEDAGLHREFVDAGRERFWDL